MVPLPFSFDLGKRARAARVRSNGGGYFALGFKIAPVFKNGMIMQYFREVFYLFPAYGELKKTGLGNEEIDLDSVSKPWRRYFDRLPMSHLGTR